MEACTHSLQFKQLVSFFQNLNCFMLFEAADPSTLSNVMSVSYKHMISYTNHPGHIKCLFCTALFFKKALSDRIRSTSEDLYIMQINKQKFMLGAPYDPNKSLSWCNTI